MVKLAVGVFSFFLSFLIPLSALSAVKMTDVVAKRSKSGLNVDITFDKPVSAKNIKPTFERNFVQLVLKSTTVDSAKLVSLNGGEITKVFAYPYNPETARLRIILKKDSDWAKGRISLWNNSPKTVRIFVRDDQRNGEVGVSGVKKAPVVTQAPTQASPATTSKDDDSKLLKEVVSNTKEIDIHDPESVKAALDRPDKNKTVDENTKFAAAKQTPDTSLGVKSDPTRHFARMAIALLAILTFFIGGVFVLKRYAGKLKGLPFGKKERLIQVVATHYLGNKKSISLVKITGEYMVVGVSNDGISLISKLGPEVNVDKYLEDRFWGGTFEKHLGTYAKDTKITKAIDLADEDEVPALFGKYDGVRDLAHAVAAPVLEQVSPVRASIKEKLMKLKPLA